MAAEEPGKQGGTRREEKVRSEGPIISEEDKRNVRQNNNTHLHVFRLNLICDVVIIVAVVFFPGFPLFCLERAKKRATLIFLVYVTKFNVGTS